MITTLEVEDDDVYIDVRVNFQNIDALPETIEQSGMRKRNCAT